MQIQPRIYFLGLPVLLLLSFNSFSMSKEEKVAILKQSLEIFSKAYAAANVPVLEPLLTNNYIHINGSSGSVIDKQAWINWNKLRQQNIASGKEVIKRYDVQDLKIEMFENTAFVTGIVLSNGVRNGEPFDTKIRFSNVWIYTKNRWQRASFHDSSIE